MTYGYIDTSGTEIIKSKFSGVGGFIDGTAIVKKSNKTGIINTSGKYLVRPGDELIYRNAKYKVFAVVDEKNKKMKFLDSKLKDYALPKDSLEYFVSCFGISFMRTYNKIYSTKFEMPEEVAESETVKIITSSVKDKIGKFSEGKAPYGARKSYGLYNEKGEQLYETKYLKIFRLKSGIICLRDVGEISYIK